MARPVASLGHQGAWRSPAESPWVKSLGSSIPHQLWEHHAQSLIGCRSPGGGDRPSVLCH